MANLASKLGLIGPQMWQIWEFLRSVSVHFGSARIWGQFDPFGCQIWHPALVSAADPCVVLTDAQEISENCFQDLMLMFVVLRIEEFKKVKNQDADIDLIFLTNYD